MTSARLLPIRETAAYLGVGVQTIRDWTHAGILTPVRLPGSLIRDDGGQIVSKPNDRPIHKFLFYVRDLDALVDRMKAEE
jgi:excisionase family DNA binding protein